MKAEMGKSIQNKEELEKKIENLNRDIENLKITLNSSKKDGWRKNFVTKAYKWMKDPNNRQLLGDGYKVIKELIPEQYKESLPGGDILK